MGVDTRPNKALDPDRLQFVLRGYPLADLLVNIARHGIVPAWKKGLPPQQNPPRNHRPARLFKPALMKSIRQGQSSGTYLVVNLSMLRQWTHIQCSPFGAVEKKDVDPRLEVRPIHDLSFPDTTSTNSFLNTDCLPEIEFTCVAAIAVTGLKTN
ncbi:hypothetical protein V7S43_012300 [Phytophthora oleae]|uniref:PiggyBac transposable element-derived protein domain-containing protein n=1 Tax=Phytophthora oleae TaxID=2107226 RepID=A0ABD3F8V3_9STRA